jgi:hypothetical protein
MKLGQVAETERDWAAFDRKYRAEMADPEKSRILDLLAALSHSANFSVGCYCENEARCHRSILRELLAQRGAAAFVNEVARFFHATFFSAEFACCGSRGGFNHTSVIGVQFRISPDQRCGRACLAAS